jgi:hypothetical protein
MSTQATHTPNAATVGTPPKVGSTAESSGMSGAFGQISMGPQAVAMQALYQVMSLYEQIMVLYNEQTQTSQSAANAAISAAASQAEATRDQAIGSFVNAGVTVGTMTATTVSTAKNYNEATQFHEEYAEYEGNRGQLLNKMQDNTSTDVTVGTDDDPRTQEMQQRINSLTTKGRLQTGDYQEPDTTGQSAKQRATTIQTAREDATQEAISHMTPEERQQMLETLNEKQDTASRNENNAYTQIQNKQQKWQNMGNIANNLTSGATGVAQSMAQTAQGQAQATQSLANTTCQMSQTMVSNSEQFIGKFYDQQIQELQLLQQIASNSQVRS